MIQQACESDLEVLPIQQGNQQDIINIEDKPNQSDDDDDDQRDKIKTSGNTHFLLFLSMIPVPLNKDSEATEVNGTGRQIFSSQC